MAAYRLHFLHLRLHTLSRAVRAGMAACALLVLSSGASHAISIDSLNTDAMFAGARDAYQARDELALAQYADQLQAQNYVLALYADYWLMLLRLNQADTVSVRDFLRRYEQLPFADRLRGEWLKALAKRQEWATFLEELPKFQRDDAAVSCYTVEAHADQDKTALAEGKALWLSPVEQPANCSMLYDRMQAAGVLTKADIWARFRLALQEGKPGLAKGVALRLQEIDTGALKLIDRAYQNPQQLLEKKSVAYKNTYGRALNLYALDRVARNQPDYALELWQKAQANYNKEERSYFWGRLGLHAARKHNPRALEYFSQAIAGSLDKEQLAWKARTAMRILDWPLLQSTIAEMPAAQQDEAVWRYWQGRALKEQKQIPAANALFVPLSRERSYYGLLAEEELGDVITAQPSNYKPSDAEIAAVKSLPGMQRAIELQRFDMRWESRMEWVFATKDMDDKQLLAAAELASRQDWFDLAILTADKTKLMHDYSLRYPTPYRSSMQSFAREQGLDEAWVYGITRQESRFMHYAKSGVGASGLMQVMPATATWIAKRMGLDSYRNDMIHQLDTNIQLGTYYLRYTLDLMGGQTVMATAAYNAGPGRARRWAAPQALEGPIYAETIPFSETRGYVQKVMANAYFYANRLGTKVQTLKQRLGVINGTTAILVSDDDEKADKPIKLDETSSLPALVLPASPAAIPPAK